MFQPVTLLPENKISGGHQLMRVLVNGHFTPGAAWGGNTFRLKFLCRSLLSWRLTLALADFLSSSVLMERILQAQPNLPCKLHRPYLTARMSKLECLFALRDHYTLIVQRMPTRLLLGHLDREPLVLGKVTDKQNNGVSLKISSVDQLNKEGEITLSFCNADDVALSRITFSLINYQQKTTLFIGGLQGPDNSVPHTEIHDATKACYGLFPKRVALEGISILARYLGIEQIIAVDNLGHVYQNWRYHHKKKDQLYADYDQFWLSAGGQSTTAGYFQLPLHIPRKSIAHIASKKRAEYRRRYQLLDELEYAVSLWFDDAPDATDIE